MTMGTSAGNPLISSRPSDSGFHVALHPLVLLTISDYATRHAARQQKGAIVGALLGQQQQGRQITLEHAFECHTITNAENEVVLDSAWFAGRLQQYRDVHKQPPLDIVGWFTLTPATGPSASLLAIHRQILQEYNESALLLAFHPAQVASSSETGAKLPLTIFETVFEGENLTTDTKGSTDERNLPIRFRELPYSIETGEAEMISVDFVAKGAGNAMAIVEPAKTPSKGPVTTSAAAADTKAIGNSVVLSPENEEFVNNLSTRLNAVKTLESRIRLIRSFLENLPQITSESTVVAGTASHTAASGTHSILRNINSLVSGLSLLNPQDSVSFTVESLAQENDVALISLLGRLGENVKTMRELGKKSAIVESSKHQPLDVLNKPRKYHMDFPSRRDDQLRESKFVSTTSTGSQMI